jgi:tripartite-type tricarboxylate transporter receptor subunit TctC
MSKRRALALLTFALLARSAGAEPIADFYRGKTISLMIGVNVGGSYDRNARLVARYLGSSAWIAHPNRGSLTQLPPQWHSRAGGGGSISPAKFLTLLLPEDAGLRKEISEYPEFLLGVS